MATDSGTSVYISSAGGVRSAVIATCGLSEGEKELGACQIELVNILALRNICIYRVSMNTLIH